MKPPADLRTSRPPIPRLPVYCIKKIVKSTRSPGTTVMAYLWLLQHRRNNTCEAVCRSLQYPYGNRSFNDAIRRLEKVGLIEVMSSPGGRSNDRWCVRFKLNEEWTQSFTVRYGNTERTRYIAQIDVNTFADIRRAASPAAAMYWLIQRLDEQVRAARTSMKQPSILESDYEEMLPHRVRRGRARRALRDIGITTFAPYRDEFDIPPLKASK